MLDAEIAFVDDRHVYGVRHSTHDDESQLRECAKASWHVDLIERVSQQARRRFYRCREIRLHVGTIVVTESSAGTVIPDNLGLEMSARKIDHLQSYRVGYW